MSEWIAADWPAPEHIVAGTILKDAADTVLPLPGKPCLLDQVHGTNVVTAGNFETRPRADGSVGSGSEHVCVVRTADCLPVLVCSADGRVFAAAHAGWRGLAAGVIENTLTKLAVDPSELLAWLGPAISQPSFEVGDEVRAAFVAVQPAAAECFVRNGRGRWQADLYGLARQRLESAGVRNIFGGGFCTFLDERRFHSFRRDPDCGRMVSFVGSKSP
ncbi:MAG: peptidoglycan editing factor PgeF [Gammaproteobacteria bacterium]|nr:peptidoglycan editing factor PgeF [Gammaproteobacteria bacterium]